MAPVSLSMPRVVGAARNGRKKGVVAGMNNQRIRRKHARRSLEKSSVAQMTNNDASRRISNARRNNGNVEINSARQSNNNDSVRIRNGALTSSAEMTSSGSPRIVRFRIANARKIDKLNSNSARARI